MSPDLRESHLRDFRTLLAVVRLFEPERTVGMRTDTLSVLDLQGGQKSLLRDLDLAELLHPLLPLLLTFQ